MPTVEAQIETERPSRYLVQLCKHAASMGGGHGPLSHLRDRPARDDLRVRAEWTDVRGTITFDPWGQCVIEAGPNALALRVEAADDECLRRIQDILTKDFARFGRRDNLTVRWQHPTGTAS